MNQPKQSLSVATASQINEDHVSQCQPRPRHHRQNNSNNNTTMLKVSEKTDSENTDNMQQLGTRLLSKRLR